MLEPQEASLRPLSQLSAAHVEGSLINLVTIKIIWWSAKQNILITNDFLWNDLMTHIGDTFLVVKASFKNPESIQPAAEHRGLSLSAGTRGVLHHSYCSCISDTQLDSTVLVYSTKIHDILSWNSGSRQMCLSSVSSGDFRIQTQSPNWRGSPQLRPSHYHGRHPSVGPITHKATGCPLYSYLSLCHW